MAQDCSGGRFLKWADSPKCQCSANEFIVLISLPLKLTVKDREAWHAAIHGGYKESDSINKNKNILIIGNKIKTDMLSEELTKKLL